MKPAPVRQRGSVAAGFHRPAVGRVRAAVPAFGITIYKEGPDVLSWCLRNIRSAYPNAPVFVISDGHDDPGYSQVCRWLGADYHRGERLKLPQHGAAWWQRFLSVAAGYGTAYAFKIDPDTCIHRAFRSFPRFDLFGTMVNELVQGGIQGFTAVAIRKILRSGACLDPAWRDPAAWAHDDASKYYLRTRRQVSTDYLLLHIGLRLGLRSGEWDEVDSMWMPTRPFRAGVAATHPHKVMGEGWRVEGEGTEVGERSSPLSRYAGRGPG